MFFLKEFKTMEEYTNYYNGEEYLFPNTSHVIEGNVVKYEPVEKSDGDLYAIFYAIDNSAVPQSLDDDIAPMSENATREVMLCYNCELIAKITVDDKTVFTNDGSKSGPVYHECEVGKEYEVRYTLIPVEEKIISPSAFRDCDCLMMMQISDDIVAILEHAFDTSGLYELYIGKGLEYIGNQAFHDSNLEYIEITKKIAPEVESDSFYSVVSGGHLEYPEGSDYSSWLSTDSVYLGYYGWNNIGPAEPA